MTTQPYQTKGGDSQFRPVMTDAELWECNEGSMGFCLACGNEQHGVEPDARKYKCHACGKEKVYGFEELVVMGLVIIQ